MIYSAALTADLHRRAADHLLRPDGQEDLCFALWHPSRGRDRMTALIHDLVLPRDIDRRVHGNVSFLPGYFERAIAEARASGAGLAFMHSHGGPGWQGMSGDDVAAEKGHAAAVKAATGLPFVGLTFGTDGSWSARFWEKMAPRTYERQWCESVRVVGYELQITFADILRPRPAVRPELQRTLSAWGGQRQAQLARLRIGVIGAGSVGSIIAEALARMGIVHIRLLDFDDVELVNLDRLLHATRRDIGRAKVDVLARSLLRSASAYPFQVDPFEWSIAEPEGFRAALDCDVLFSCVDRPWPRSVLNLIAYAHLIPVIDGGIFVRASLSGKGLKGADWRAHVVGPGRRCLECIGQYDPGMVSAERDGYFDDPAYIAGLPDDHMIRRNQNVFAFSLSAASFEVLQLLSMVVASTGAARPGAQMYHFVPGCLDTTHDACAGGCPYPLFLARGDDCGIDPTGQHLVAQVTRDRRRSREQGIRRRAMRWMEIAAERLLDR